VGGALHATCENSRAGTDVDVGVEREEAAVVARLDEEHDRREIVAAARVDAEAGG
jgi:hypothetical protein